jgi:hypothetical protein
MGTMKVYGIGRLGVNTDTDPWSLADQECRQMQNAQQTPVGVLGNRPGFKPVNALPADAAVIGGVGVPLGNLSSSGTRFLFIGRGPTT